MNTKNDGKNVTVAGFGEGKYWEKKEKRRLAEEAKIAAENEEDSE